MIWIYRASSKKMTQTRSLVWKWKKMSKTSQTLISKNRHSKLVGNLIIIRIWSKNNRSFNGNLRRDFKGDYCDLEPLDGAKQLLRTGFFPAVGDVSRVYDLSTWNHECKLRWETFKTSLGELGCLLKEQRKFYRYNCKKCTPHHNYPTKHASLVVAKSLCRGTATSPGRSMSQLLWTRSRNSWSVPQQPRPQHAGHFFADRVDMRNSLNGRWFAPFQKDGA